MKTITVRIPLIVTSDGKWAASGGHSVTEETADWSWLEEMCDDDPDYENSLVNPQRMWVTAELPLPVEATEVKATDVEIAS